MASRTTKKEKPGSNSSGSYTSSVNDSSSQLAQQNHLLTVTNEQLRLSVDGYRDQLDQLQSVNDDLRTQLSNQEADVIQVLAAMKSEKSQIEHEKATLIEKLDVERVEWQREKNELRDHYEKIIKELNDDISKKDEKIASLQDEVQNIDQFTKRRREFIAQMEAQKQQIKEMEQKYQETLTKVEKRFFEEKLILQRDTRNKLQELAVQAHTEAVANLNETTKNIYLENHQLAAAIQDHSAESFGLKKTLAKLDDENKRLKHEMDTHDVIIKEKIVSSKKQSQEIRELKKKISTLEGTLTQIIIEFRKEKEQLLEVAKQELAGLHELTEQLRESLTRKSTEMKYIRRLALHILGQRTDLERFFMDAFEYVRQELRKDEIQKKLDGVIADSSNNLEHKPDKVDVGELTWHDKQRVMRLLFAKMNGHVKGQRQPEKSPHFEQDVKIAGILKNDIFYPQQVNDAVLHAQKTIQQSALPDQ